EKAFADAPLDHRPHWLIFIPIREGARTVGAILFYRIKPQRLTNAERHVLQTLATALSFALHHLQSREHAREAANREELTHQLLADIRSAATVDAILKAAVDGLGKTLHLSRVVIFKGKADLQPPSLDGNGRLLAVRAEYRQSALVPSLLGSHLDLGEGSLLPRLIAGEIIVIADSDEGNPLARALFVRLGVRALVLAPIAYQGHLVAALALEQFDHPRLFTSEELRLI